MDQPHKILPEVLERERVALAEELHEGLCQDLCGISIQVKILERKIGAANVEFGNDIADLRQNLEAAIDQIRILSRKLKPPIWGIDSLASALREFAETIQPKGRCQFVFDQFNFEIEPLHAHALFRITQETVKMALANPAAHLIEISLRTREGRLHLKIVDGLVAAPLGADNLSFSIIHSYADQAGLVLVESPEKTNSSIEILLDASTVLKTF